MPNADVPDLVEFAKGLAVRFLGRFVTHLTSSQATLAASPAGEELPLEFVVLEAALVTVCHSLEAAVVRASHQPGLTPLATDACLGGNVFHQGALHAETTTALDALTTRVSFASLDAVNKSKGSLTDVATRVTALRDEIHRYLLDDSDSAWLEHPPRPR